MSNITIHSGGAQGSDSFFGYYASDHGLKVIHHSFPGHKIFAQGERLEHDYYERYEANIEVRAAAKRLNKSCSFKSVYIQSLIQRNYFQIRDVNLVFAISKLTTDKKNVEGGTGWAVAMAINKHADIFVFDDGQSEKWYKFDFNFDCFRICGYLPTIKENFAGIGTRNISTNGIKAIAEVISKA